MKAKYFFEVKKFSDIPNIGPAMIKDFKLMGITEPKHLKNKPGILLYQKLCALTKTRHDPCVLDTFLAVEDFVKGAPAKPWFAYTANRKKKYGSILKTMI